MRTAERASTMSINITVVTVIVFLLPMFYLLLASPSFLLVRLDIPQVARLLRAMFGGYFSVLAVVGPVCTVFNLVEGRQLQAFVLGLATAIILVWRHWMMLRLDAGLAEIQAGIAGAAPRLRRLHCMGMLVNALQTATVVALIPSLVVVA